VIEKCNNADDWQGLSFKWRDRIVILLDTDVDGESFM
jgi:hypothetical protein